MAQDRTQAGRRWLWLGAAVFIVIVFFTTRYLTRERLPVRDVQVRYQELINTVATNGRVEPELNYEYPSPIATTVKAVYVHSGDVVPAGKLLVQLDDVEARARLATAESGVKTAQAAVEAATHNGTQQERQMSAAETTRSRLERDQARRDLDALTKLKSTGAASANEVAAARQRLDTAEGSLRAAEESSHNRYSATEIERAKAALTDAEANLAVAREVVAQASYRAPIAGTVYSVDAGPTEFVEQGKKLLELADLSHERVVAYFDEPVIGQLAVGQQVLIKWDARHDQQWHGHIVRTPKTVITYGTTRTVGEVLVELDDPPTGLLPDTNVTVTVTTSTEPRALSVPREALHSENGKPYVFKVEKNELVKTPVTTGTINLTQVSILTGLKEGDFVATGTTSGQPLQEGIQIKVVR